MRPECGLSLTPVEGGCSAPGAAGRLPLATSRACRAAPADHRQPPLPLRGRQPPSSSLSHHRRGAVQQLACATRRDRCARMLLAAALAPAGLAVLAARSLQPISRADALHTRMSGPAALHNCDTCCRRAPMLAHDCRWQISACWHGYMDFATAQWKLRGDCKVANPRVGVCRRFSIAVQLVHLQFGLLCGRVFCTRPHGLAYEFGRRQLPQRAPTTATSNGNGGDAGVWRSVSIMCTVLFEVARLGLVSVGVRTCTVLGRSSCASELHSNFV